MIVNVGIIFCHRLAHAITFCPKNLACTSCEVRFCFIKFLVKVSFLFIFLLHVCLLYFQAFVCSSGRTLHFTFTFFHLPVTHRSMVNTIFFSQCLHSLVFLFVVKLGFYSMWMTTVSLFMIHFNKNKYVWESSNFHQQIKRKLCIIATSYKIMLNQVTGHWQSVDTWTLWGV